MSENFALQHDPKTAQTIELILTMLREGITQHVQSWVTLLRELVDWSRLVERVKDLFGVGEGANMELLAQRFWEWIAGSISERLAQIALSPDDFVIDPSRYTRCQAYIEWSDYCARARPTP